MVVLPAVIASVCGALKPPQLLLSALFGLTVVPWEPRANLTDELAASPVVQVSDASPLTGHQGSPAVGDFPCRVIVPVKAEPVLLVTVKNPLSGPAEVSQIVPLVLQ